MSEEGYEARSVRPYAVTGGRVRARSDLPLEALIEAQPAARPTGGLPPEKRSILQYASEDFISVAELSALLHLPIGVTRIIVSDLADGDYIRIVGSADSSDSSNGDASPALSLSVLESVLNGISAL
ncbi:MAG: DUF742 domain-containing protein [Micrococcales bacterium]|nr:DUF742 domain-containing protein [Micrococcales bacterium]